MTVDAVMAALQRAIVPVVVLDVWFFPSGGIRPDTARSYLDHPAVFAIGASWMVGRADTAAGRFDLITWASRAAVAAIQPDGIDVGVRA